MPTIPMTRKPRALARARAGGDTMRRRRAPARGAGRRIALFLAVLLALSGAVARPAAADGGQEIGAKIFDATVLRPLNGAALVLGTIFFAISAPLVAPGGNIDSTWDAFVIAPYEYTVLRPLGDF